MDCVGEEGEQKVVLESVKICVGCGIGVRGTNGVGEEEEEELQVVWIKREICGRRGRQVRTMDQIGGLYT